MTQIFHLQKKMNWNENLQKNDYKILPKKKIKNSCNENLPMKIN